jgi:exonuclease III
MQVCRIEPYGHRGLSLYVVASTTSFHSLCLQRGSQQCITHSDVICFQETKIRRGELDRDLSIVEGW